MTRTPFTQPGLSPLSSAYLSRRSPRLPRSCPLRAPPRAGRSRPLAHRGPFAACPPARARSPLRQQVATAARAAPAAAGSSAALPGRAGPARPGRAGPPPQRPGGARPGRALEPAAPLPLGTILKQGIAPLNSSSEYKEERG